MNPHTQTADTLIHPGCIVPVIPHGVVLENHSIAITGNRITALLPRAEADNINAAEVVDLPGHALLPGLINCHGHAAMSLLQGLRRRPTANAMAGAAYMARRSGQRQRGVCA